MTYTILATNLHFYADAARAHFVNEFGIANKSFRIETGFQADLLYCPTLHAVTKEGWILCVEVSDNPFPVHLNAAVLDCLTKSLPVKLYVVVPGGTLSGANMHSLSMRCKSKGVGLIEIDTQRQVTAVADPLLLSLNGLREIDVKGIPPKLKTPLKDARQTFVNGNPSKGCSDIYDLVEDWTRRIGKKANKNGWWKNSQKDPKPASIKFETDNWGRIANCLAINFDKRAAGCPDLSPTLFDRISGITMHRNQSGHRPKTAALLKKRDSELRTRFESAVDLLVDVVNASRPMRL